MARQTLMLVFLFQRRRHDLIVANTLREMTLFVQVSAGHHLITVFPFVSEVLCPLFFEQHTFKWSIPPSTTILTIKKGLSMQGTFIESKLRDNAKYVMRSWHSLDSFIWVEHQLPKIDFLMMKSFLLNKLCLNQTIKCMLNVASRGLVHLRAT